MRCCLVLALCALALPRPGGAQALDSLGRSLPPHWTAGVLGLYERVNRDQPDWQTAEAHVGHKVHGLSWNAALLHVRRFGQADAAAALDTYADVGRGAYANLRVQAAPGADVLPRADISAMGFSPAARVWEVGAGARGLWFRDDRVALFTGSAGRYAGNYFVVGRATVVPRASGSGLSGTLTVRRFFATPGAFAEVQAGGGREVVTLGAGPQVDVRRTVFASVRGVQRLSGPLWLTVGAGYTDDEVFPRASATLGFDVRW